MTEEHLCEGTDGDSAKCIFNWQKKHVIYGWCGDDHCGGVCEAWGDCTCSCHAVHDTTDMVGSGPDAPKERS